MQRIGDGTLDVLVDRTYPSEDSGAAHRDLESQETVGGSSCFRDRPGPAYRDTNPAGSRTAPRPPKRCCPARHTSASCRPAGRRKVRAYRASYLGRARTCGAHRIMVGGHDPAVQHLDLLHGLGQVLWGGRRRSRFLGAKIKVSGRLSGKWRSRGPAWRIRASVRARSPNSPTGNCAAPRTAV